MLKLRETELKPLIFCLQSAVEFYGLEKAVELAKATL